MGAAFGLLVVTDWRGDFAGSARVAWLPLCASGLVTIVAVGPPEPDPAGRVAADAAPDPAPDAPGTGARASSAGDPRPARGGRAWLRCR